MKQRLVHHNRIWTTNVVSAVFVAPIISGHLRLGQTQRISKIALSVILHSEKVFVFQNGQLATFFDEICCRSILCPLCPIDGVSQVHQTALWQDCIRAFSVEATAEKRLAICSTVVVAVGGFALFEVEWKSNILVSMKSQQHLIITIVIMVI